MADWSEDRWTELRAVYYGMCARVDHQFGLVMQALEEPGGLDNAYIVLIADHGELLLDHGFGGKAERHYDACIRVPLIISGPGSRQGLSCDRLVQHEDIFPTVLEMAGLPQPEPRTMGPYLKERPRALYGESLLGLCRGETPGAWRDAVYIESYNNIGTATPANWARTVRTAEWRYTMYPQGNGEQLFNLKSDPDEQINLARVAECAGVRQEMRDRLLELVILQDYPQPVRDLFAIGVH